MNMSLFNPILQSAQTSRLDFPSLKNASITAIKIPIRANSSPNTQLNVQPVTFSSGAESDLTELSWLTNNVNTMFSKSAHSALLPYPPQQSASAFSCYARRNDDDSSYLGSSASSLSNHSSPSTSPCSHYSSATSTNNPDLRNSCGSAKPPLTLSCLIFMAIQESKNKCLPVREIYEWIELNFAYYKNASNGGWKSSIRHNLSFSKCFKKMDRAESVLHRVKHEERVDTLTHSSGRKKRAPNSTGTCWKVNPECKSYLVQTLKKSSFWFHNARNYPSLSRYVNNYQSELKLKPNEEEEEEAQPANLKKAAKKPKLSELAHLAASSNDHEEDAYLNSANEMSLFEFVQRQQEKMICLGGEELKKQANKMGSSLDSKELAAAAVLAAAYSPQSLELSLSSSSSSLSSEFSLLSSSSGSSNSDELRRKRKANGSREEIVNTQMCINSMSLNSDLEMEVASTLVGMKWSGSKRE
jgi:hypothetical protein